MIPNPITDPAGFWTAIRDHHDRKSTDGLAVEPATHEDLAWKAQCHLTAIENSTNQRGEGS